MGPQADATPLRVETEPDRTPEPCAVVVFGATGDLTRRKLVPALYSLYLDRLLPPGMSIVGVARRKIGTEEFAGDLERGTRDHSRRPFDADVWKDLASKISYVGTDFDNPEGYGILADHLARLDREQGRVGNRLFYLATPPSSFPVIVRRLKEAGLSRPATGGAWSRMVVEKPFGQDLATARELNRTVNDAFPEKAVYRIDHYLGKETVQNLIVFRFANAIFEPLWNQKYVDHVQMTVAEAIGVEGRGKYYEEAGMLRDMVQNHLFQLLCLTAMEPPVSLDANAIRDEKVKVLHSLRPVPLERVSEETVRGQYAAGIAGGRSVPGYREEPGVAPSSRTETYVAVRVHIDNWRWAGVPFYLRAGKRLPRRATEIRLQFRDVPHRLFRAEAQDRPDANSLALRIQPDEGIALKIESKVPGSAPSIRSVTMDFRYGTSFGEEPPEAYERLILDAMLGDSTLFIRRDEVEASWSYIDRLEEAWRQEETTDPLPSYRAGTWGPVEADGLLSRDGRKWREP